jgi:flagellin
MSLRINTNIAALTAHKNMIKNDNSLSASLEKLSSGLRINKAADDASGMAIADSLRSQALGLGQAVRNANDGINIVQTADGALDESIKIVGDIRTKASQSGQDGQTTESRKAIQADISKLMEELDMIAKTTSFNGQKLLSGNFINKKFQVGAYSGETVNISIGSGESTKIGHLSTSDLTFGGEGVTQLSLYSNVQNKSYSLNAIEVKYDNNPEHGLAAVADAINKLSDVLGITAKASVTSTTAGSVAAGTTDASFAINGVNIGEVAVAAGDSTGSLVKAINGKTSQHGVYAAVGSDGTLTLTANDGRAIKVTQDANTDAILGGTDMSTLGKIQMTQAGTGAIAVTDAKAVTGLTINAADGLMEVSGGTATIVDTVVTAGSILASGTTFGSGTVLQGTFEVTTATTATTKDGSIIGAGSILASGSVIGSGVLAANVTVDANTVTTAGTKDSVLVAGTYLSSGSSIADGSIFEGDVTAFLSGANVVYRDGKTYTSGAAGLVKSGGLTLTAGATVATGSVFEEDSVIAAGSLVRAETTTKGTTTILSNMAASEGLTITSGSKLATGTVINGGVFSGKGTVTGDMIMKSASKIADESSLANGSTISSTGKAGINIWDDEVVGPKGMLLKTDSVILSGSTLAAGTVLSDDVSEDDGEGAVRAVYKKGTVLNRDIVTNGDVTLTGDATLAAGSKLLAGSTIGNGDAARSVNTDSSTSDAKAYRLSDVDVTTQAGAQIAMSIADAAIKDLDKVRSDLGSVQNQLTSTISNLSVTKINVMAAESSIRDVDFAEESANFSKMQILSQAGTFAMAQANASSQNVLSLLQ